MEYISIKATSEKWNISESRITKLCRDGRISKAKKEKGVWLIPQNAEKPSDARKMGRIPKNAELRGFSERLPLPIGISDFKAIADNYYYVDKTLLIKDFIDSRPGVSLFTRPRRFGKTLAMSMIRTFFEKTESDTSKYFKNLDIWSCGEKYTEHQGKYPVIYLSFKDVKYLTWDETIEDIKHILREEYSHHSELMTSSKLSEYDINSYKSMLDGAVTNVDLTNALSILSKLLSIQYDEKVVVIVDEYDTPIQQGYISGYYQQIVDFMRTLFSGAFKDNNNLMFGFLTGILRVSKESIFSGLNNLKVNTILEDRYSQYFGFTKDEITELAEYYGKADKIDEICEWYDGYRFGNTDIFNPWSVLNYFDENCHPKAFWQATGDNSIIRQIVSEADSETSDNLRRLMEGDSISVYVDMSIIYPDIKNNPYTIYSFLLASGYLKIASKNDNLDGSIICDVAIPNKEIQFVYGKEILSSMSEVIPPSTAVAIQQAIVSGNIDSFNKLLQEFLLNTISSFDYAYESFYHGIMLGLCSVLNNTYIVSSNRESGNGRYDIQLKPILKESLPGIIIEIKAITDKVSEEKMSEVITRFAQKALKQIDDKAYVTNMKNEGIKHFVKIGIAFYKKHVNLVYSID